MLLNNDIMKYDNINIVFQEIPNEISLTFSITGCQLKCDGCHSSYLWKNRGTELSDHIFIQQLNKYKNQISVVLFMGGEWNYLDLLHKLDISIKLGFKTALYTGLTYDQILQDKPKLIDRLNYIKIGKYIKHLGGLNSIATNQKLIDLKNNQILNHYFIK